MAKRKIKLTASFAFDRPWTSLERSQFFREVAMRFGGDTAASGEARAFIAEICAAHGANSTRDFRASQFATIMGAVKDAPAPQ